MNQTADLFEQAQRLHEKGLNRKAEPLYLQALQAQPDHEDALFWLASLYTNEGRHRDAVPLYYRALELNPAAVETHTGLGLALNALGQAEEAESAFRFALDLSPELAELPYYLGAALFAQKKFTDAEAAFRQAIKLKPDFQEAQINLRETLLQLNNADAAAKIERQRVEAMKRAETAAPKAALKTARVKPLPARALSAANYVNEANHLANLRQPEKACPLYQKAIEADPNFQPAYYGWGTTLLQAGRLKEAIPLLEKAAALKPNDEAAVGNLANALLATQDYLQSSEYFRKATGIAPKNPLHWLSLSAIFIYLRRLPEAEDAARRALEIQPDFAMAEVNLGIALMEQGAHEEAMTYSLKAAQSLPDNIENLMLLSSLYARSGNYEAGRDAMEHMLRLQPQEARARAELGLLQLLYGHYGEGWENYKATYLLSDVSQRRFDKPEWKREYAPDATVLVQINQGVGDCIQFLRYLSALKEKVGRIVLESHDYTRALYANHPAVAEVIRPNTPVEFDYWVCSTMLAGLFWEPCRAQPDAAYLAADAEKSEIWRQYFAAKPGFKVGIVWAGNKSFINDHLRSTKLETFAPLKAIPNVRLYSLQKGEQAEQAKTPPDGMTLIDLSDELRNFGDTAAVIANLDLVISVDTSVAHLAGALGKPVWTLIPSVPEWRWLRQGDTTEWYSTMRLFRAETFNGWSKQMEKVVEALNQLVNPAAASETEAA